MSRPIILASASFVRLTKTQSELLTSCCLFDYMILYSSQRIWALAWAAAMLHRIVQPHVHLRIEHVQRQGAVIQEFIVEIPKVKSRSKILLHLASYLGDL